MKTLVLNCGSSSLKFQLIDTSESKLIAKGLIEKIGTTDAIINFRPTQKSPVREIRELKNHDEALKVALGLICDKTVGVIDDINQIEAVGHRVVHGGEYFSEACLITDDVINAMKECSVFAPLHNPPNIMGIEACISLIKGVKQVAVFDTAFHQKIPKHAYIYGLPYELYEKLKIRRYGFHGTSHSYVSKKTAEILQKDYQNFKVVVCHLGNGASISAVKNGHSIDTSMGFTPLEGLLMGTRCGDIDPAIIPYIMQKENLSYKEVDNLLNKESGLLGITKTSCDMREIEDKMFESESHMLAFDIFCYRIKKYIGAYIAALNGIDALVFTAGIGENSYFVREKVCSDMQFFGIEIDTDKNNRNDLMISTGKIPVMVVPTEEELAIAMETQRVLNQINQNQNTK